MDQKETPHFRGVGPTILSLGGDYILVNPIRNRFKSQSVIDNPRAPPLHRVRNSAGFLCLESMSEVVKSPFSSCLKIERAKRRLDPHLLALTLYNSDLYLAEKFEGQDISPFYPVGDLLEIKRNRLLTATGYSDKLWTLFEINGVPDLSQIDLTQGSNLSDLLEVATNKNAKDFRDWFHKNQELSEKEILHEYLGVIQQVPWAQRLPSKALRFAVISVSGLVPLLGLAISFFDSFIVDKLFKGRSPKFFIDDLTNIKGNLKLQPPPEADGS